LEDLVDDLRTGLALGFFHDEADERSDGALFTRLVFLNGFGHFLDGFFAPLCDSSLITHGGETFGFDDLLWSAASFKHLTEDILGGLACDGPLLDESHKLRQSFRGDGRV